MLFYSDRKIYFTLSFLHAFDDKFKVSIWKSCRV